MELTVKKKRARDDDPDFELSDGESDENTVDVAALQWELTKLR